MDDNRNRILLVKFVDQPNEPDWTCVFHLGRIVNGKETVLLKKGKERLRHYWLRRSFGRKQDHATRSYES